MSPGRQPPFRRGEKLSAKRLNEALNSRLVTSTGGGAAAINQIHDEGTIRVEPARLNKYLPKHIAQFKVKSVSATYYICRLWDGTNEISGDIKVAK